MPDTQDVTILLEEREVSVAIELAKTSPVNYTVEPKAQAVDPITAILIGGGVLAVAKFVSDLFDRLKGGVVVNLQKQPPVITRSKDLPAGWVLVIAADGEVKIETRDAPKDAIERLLSEVIKGVFGSAKEVTSRARELLGKKHVAPDEAA